MKLICILIMLLVVVSCENDNKQSIRFEHEILEKYVIEKMNADNINYTKDKYNNYWYSVDDKDVVSSFMKTQADLISIGIEVSDPEFSELFKEDILSNDIKFKLEHFSDGRLLFLFEREQYDNAKFVFHDSMEKYSAIRSAK